MNKEDYIISGGEEGAKRLHLMSEIFWPATKKALDKIELESGMNCLDFGCGAGNVTAKLAKMVGDSGKVTGMDMDAGVLEFAQAHAQTMQINADFEQLSIEELQVQDTFDLTYSRFLLSHLANPADGLNRLIAATKPNGWIMVEDISIAQHLHYPPNAAISRYIEIYTSSAQSKGADPNIGPRLLTMFQNAGLKDIELEVSLPTFYEGTGKSIARITLKNIAQTAIEMKITTQEEIEALLAEIEQFEKDKGSILSTAMVFTVWGKKV